MNSSMTCQDKLYYPLDLQISPFIFPCIWSNSNYYIHNIFILLECLVFSNQFYTIRYQQPLQHVICEQKFYMTINFEYMYIIIDKNLQILYVKDDYFPILDELWNKEWCYLHKHFFNLTIIDDLMYFFFNVKTIFIKSHVHTKQVTVNNA